MIDRGRFVIFNCWEGVAGREEELFLRLLYNCFYVSEK